MLRGYLFILSAALCWGFIGIFSNLAFSQGITPMEVGFWRAVIAWLCFAGQAMVQRELRLDLRDIPLLVLFALFGVTLFYFCYLFTVQEGGAAFASILLYTAPAWVLISAYILHRHRPSCNQALSICLVIAGVFLISRSGGNAAADVSLSYWAIFTGLASGFCYSLYYTIGKYFSTRYSSANLFLYVMPIGAAALFPFVDFAPKSQLAWIAILLVSVVSTFVANYCYYKSLKFLDATTSSIVATVEPVVAAVAAYIFLGEYFTLAGYIGAAVILTAVLITVKRG
ncbi:DMT family transporter [Desulfogranum mediterraneum]|uniref:DMT family transporter n=1 Tax=Desulfogranum mediterraneum TaxID=160661 RepID=UPI00048D92DA|nr:DMT family transporter [Desulfogranum mediterraneum]